MLLDIIEGEEEDKEVTDTGQEVNTPLPTQSNYLTHGAMKFNQ